MCVPATFALKLRKNELKLLLAGQHQPEIERKQQENFNRSEIKTGRREYYLQVTVVSRLASVAERSIFTACK